MLEKHSEVTIRRIREMDDLFSIVAIQQKVWGQDSLVYTSPHLVKVHVEMGALVLGAFDPGLGLIGFVYSFPGKREGREVHWSHMLAVSPGARLKGTGKLLKWRQREEILKSEMDLCYWTFDPLQGINARLNLVTLGARIDSYEVDTYGSLNGYLDFGLPTDRFIARWDLDSAYVEDHLNGKAKRVSVQDEYIAPVLQIVEEKGMLVPQTVDESPESELVGIQVPANINELRSDHKDVALQWRILTREAFNTFLGRGYGVVDVLTPGESELPHFVYVLRRQ